MIAGLNYFPEPTGTGKYTGEMAAWLASRGHSVEAICGLPHYPAWEVDARYAQLHADGGMQVETLDGVRVVRVAHHVPSASGLTAKARIWIETSFTLSAARFWLPRLFSRAKPDVIVVMMPPMQMGVWPLIYGMIRRVPWVLHVQDLQVDAALRLNMLKGGVLGRVLYWVESFLLRRATVVSTITEAMRRRVVEKGASPDRAWLFPNWADIETVRPLLPQAPSVQAMRAELGVPDAGGECEQAATVLVLYAGNMGEKQGLDLVLQAAARLRGDARIRFAMVGAGAARARLVAQAAELGLTNLVFAPVQPLERLPVMLAAGDVHLVVQQRAAADLVMPSKLTNILAAGRACVATADAGTALADVVAGTRGSGEAKPTGVICAAEDVDALATAIRRLADDAVLREICGRNARAYAEAYLDRDAILARFEQQLAELVTP
ncbi:WcaI family glycosyltransferase [Sinimarinibacterium sp. CAU 1509]|uniref:WcaI family glycosyltransferase n=1 Tax=Sinimarinibacterium sp. CAU 1509 TaxID=2562283 RepID=UPI00146C727F|nr:WcaI family glycosyltransferase [Sinimarinibacterium sp. CAU 1509]